MRWRAGCEGSGEDGGAVQQELLAGYVDLFRAALYALQLP